MNIKDLKPIGQLAGCYGAKILAYGQAGCGKTPLILTAPAPVVCVTEPGMLSLKGCNSVPAAACYSADEIEDFFKWLFSSSEVKNFQTVCIDSISQLAEIILESEMKKFKNKLQAYGEMSRKVMNIVNGLYFMKNLNVYMIAKLQKVQEGEVFTLRPYFPGQDLNVKIPHLFDEIFYIESKPSVGNQKPTQLINTQSGYNFIARDRSGKLLPTEQPNLTQIIGKINTL